MWNWIVSWFNLSWLPKRYHFSSSYRWWKKSRRKVDKRVRREFDGLVIYFWWEVWLERNRRIFQNINKTEQQVASFTKDDVDLQGVVILM
jgi:hypothetical protein